MANKILIKKSTVASKVPLASDLDIGELAINTADAKLYTKHSDGTIKTIVASAVLSDSGVTAGSYGSSSAIPVLSIDIYGRVTSASTSSVSIPSGSLTFTGDVTGTGTTGSSTTLTLASTGITAGTYKSVTVDAKGRVTSGSNPTTLSGYGITDAAPLESPTFTGTPIAPTANSGTNTTQIATTAFVRGEVTNLVNSAPAALDTLSELATALGNDASFATTTATALGNRVLKVVSTDNAIVRFDGTSGAVQNSECFIDDSGNLGIGTSSPSQKLHVAGTGYASTDFRAPIFYDSDNTSYYVDPASTSNLVGLTVANTITGSVSGSSASCTGNAATATSATNQSGGTVTATTGSFSGRVAINGSATETKVALSSGAINLSSGGYFTYTISSATTFSLSNIPASGNGISFILELANAGSYAITWFSGIKWANGGIAPVLTTGIDSLGFYSHDGGTTWKGFVLGKNMA